MSDERLVSGSEESNSCILGGYYLKARCIQESWVAHASPATREIWDWLIKEAAYKDKKKYGFTVKRGQILCTYSEIREGLSWKVGYRIEHYSEDVTKKCMKVLRTHQMIETKKTQYGMLITILNYNKYQDYNNYETEHKKRYEGTTSAPTRHRPGTTYIRNKEMNELNKEMNREESVDNFGDKVGDNYRLYSKPTHISDILKKLDIKEPL